jgi:putative transcriptional regulator
MSTVRRSQAEIRRTGGRVDSRRVRATTDKDIVKWIAEDPDTAPELPPEVRPQVLYTPPLPDVRRLRERLGLTQAEFAQRFGLSRRTVEQWEQGRAVPDRPARILLAVIERDPRVVERVVVSRRKS